MADDPENLWAENALGITEERPIYFIRHEAGNRWSQREAQDLAKTLSDMGKEVAVCSNTLIIQECGNRHLRLLMKAYEMLHRITTGDTPGIGEIDDLARTIWNATNEPQTQT